MLTRVKQSLEKEKTENEKLKFIHACDIITGRKRDAIWLEFER